MTDMIQPSMAGGEVSPSIGARVDLAKRAVAVERAENFIARVSGGMESRRGTRYIAQTKSPLTTRLVAFEFNTEQTYVLEFGNQYIRFYTYGAQIESGGSAYEVATPYAVADIFDLAFAQSADVMTIVHPNYAPRELVRIADTNWTLTEISFEPSQIYPTGLATTVNYTQSGTISAATQANPVSITCTGHGLSTGAEIKFAGVVGMTELNGNTYRITAIDADTFNLDGVDGTGFTAYTSGGEWEVYGTPLKYKVTANAADTFEESLAGIKAAANSITAATQANPVVLTFGGAHGLEYGDELYVSGVGGMTELNGRRFLVLSAPTTSTIQLMGLDRLPVDGTGYTAYTSGGTAATTFVGAQAAAQAWDTTISWTAAAGADSYNIYRADDGGLYSFIGRTSSLTFRDTFIEGDGDYTAPIGFDPFEGGSGTWPSTTGFFQQRQIYANSDAFPNRFWMTQTGVFYNFSRSSPLRDDDAIIATLSSLKINAIRHLLPLTDLLMLTTGAEYRVKGEGDAAFTPSTINIKPQSFHGSVALPPIVAGSTALYMSVGNVVRELSYDFIGDKFAGRDLTVLARHLFEGRTVVDWTFAQVPMDAIFVVFDDGTGACLTYQPEQEVYGWTRLTTKGKYKSVASVKENGDDAVYFIVQRFLNGITTSTVERMADRHFDEMADAFCVDCGLSLDAPISISGMTAANPVVVTTATPHGLNPGDVVDISMVKERTTDPNKVEALSSDYNGDGFTVGTTFSTTTLTLQNAGTDYDGSGFAAFSSGGVVRKAVTTLTGLGHLNGESVVAAANGYAETGLTVSGGSVTLSSPASRVHIGLPFTAQLITLPLETYANGKTIQGRPKTVPSMIVQVERTMGMWTGPTTTNMRETTFGLPATYGQPLDMVTDSITVGLKGGWTKRKQLVVEQRSPLPMHILSLIPDVIVGG